MNEPTGPGIYVVREHYANLMIWRGEAKSVEDALRQAPARRTPRKAYRVLYRKEHQ